MALKSYSGSCHCGAVRFKAEMDLGEGTIRCNCSLCTKVRTWFALVPPERYRALTGPEAETEYQWTPANRPRPNLHFRFCRTCGVRTPGRGEQGPSGGPFVFVPIAALDDVDPAEMATAPIHYLDGRHDRYDREPEQTRWL